MLFEATTQGGRGTSEARVERRARREDGGAARGGAGEAQMRAGEPRSRGLVASYSGIWHVRWMSR